MYQYKRVLFNNSIQTLKKLIQNTKVIKVNKGDKFSSNNSKKILLLPLSKTRVGHYQLIIFTFLYNDSIFLLFFNCFV